MSVWERKWTMNLGSHGMAQGEFTLEKHRSDGLVYYTLNDIKCDKFAAEAWADCRLVRRGRYLQPWAPAEPLDPFDGTNAAKYQTGIKNWLTKVTSATLRLEGDLELVIEPSQSALDPPDMDVATQAVTMLVARDAVKLADGTLRDLMVLKVRSQIGTTPLSGSPDGTGTGDPTRH
jgi:hypothetical protein